MIIIENLKRDLEILPEILQKHLLQRSPPKSSKKSKKSRGRTPNSAKRKLAFSSSASKKVKRLLLNH